MLWVVEQNKVHEIHLKGKKLQHRERYVGTAFQKRKSQKDTRGRMHGGRWTMSWETDTYRVIPTERYIRRAYVLPKDHSNDDNETTV